MANRFKAQWISSIYINIITIITAIVHIVFIFFQVLTAFWSPKSQEKQILPGKGHLLSFNYQCGSQLWLHIQFSSVQSLSHARLCDPMNRSTPGLPVHHQLPEFTQTHVHRVRDTIQPSHLLSFPSPPAPNPSQHQGLFQWVNSSHEVAKVLEFQPQHHLKSGEGWKREGGEGIPRICRKRF